MTVYIAEEIISQSQLKFNIKTNLWKMAQLKINNEKKNGAENIGDIILK